MLGGILYLKVINILYFQKLQKLQVSVFTRPQVEASFIVTIDIIDKRSNCMDITTYSAMIKVKFG